MTPADGLQAMAAVAATTARRVALATLVSLICAGCFSAFHVDRFRSPSYRPSRVRTVAVFPLLVKSAAERHANVSYGPGWFSQYTWTGDLSPAQYEPAAAVLERGAAQSFAGSRVVGPREVSSAMAGASPADVQSAVKQVAQRVSADAVLVFEVRDFTTRAAALENAQAEGRTDLVLYSATGELLWSLSAQVTRGPAGSNAAPSLAQFMEYAMERLEPEIREMMAR